MTNQEAISLLENEVLCAQTRAAGCNGQCASCDIKRPDRERFIAYGKAIRALRARTEEQDELLYSTDDQQHD